MEGVVSPEEEQASSINYVLIKLASRCNYDCTYCYWFRDGSVRSLPAVIKPDVVEALIPAIERHIARYRLKEFTCSFHGGEPTLYGVAQFKRLVRAIDDVAVRTKCDIRYAMTTNAALLSEAWIKVIVDFNVSVTVSLDGPPKINDARRVSISNEGTWHKTVSGYLDLCRAGVRPSILAVCDPDADPIEILDHLASDLGATFCDVLIPDSNHNESPSSIKGFYIKLFDHWYDEYADRGVELRILTDFMRGLLGLETQTESVGFAPTQTVCLATDGSLEPHDVLRIAGVEQIATTANIRTHEIGAITRDPNWQKVRKASISLCDTCLNCRYKNACGGGHIAQRWSDARGYDNPSVYCEDLQAIFDHIAERLSDDIIAVKDGSALPRATVAALLRAGNAEFA